MLSTTVRCPHFIFLLEFCSKILPTQENSWEQSSAEKIAHIYFQRKQLIGKHRNKRTFIFDFHPNLVSLVL